MESGIPEGPLDDSFEAAILERFARYEAEREVVNELLERFYRPRVEAAIRDGDLPRAHQLVKGMPESQARFILWRLIPV